MIRLLEGDCRERMRELADDSIDACVTDPPYELGFMGKKWDSTGIACDADVWREVFRVLKPGGHVLAFGGTRTYHRMACAIEDAGFEVRDMGAYLYGSGFPKSHNLDRQRGAMICGCENSDVQLRGLSPRTDDPACVVQENPQADMLAPMQRKTPLSADDRSLRHEADAAQRSESQSTGTEESGLEGRRNSEATEGELLRREVRPLSGLGASDGEGGRIHHGASPCDGEALRLSPDADRSRRPSGPQPGEQRSGEPAAVSDERGPQARGAWPICSGCGKPNPPRGLGTALKPALEPIFIGRKPFRGTVAANVLKHGTGALNIDACRITVDDESYAKNASGDRGHDQNRTRQLDDFTMTAGKASQIGRWPANVMHDGSEEVVSAFPESLGQRGDLAGHSQRRTSQGIYGDLPAARNAVARDDAGSAACFFYSAKASRSDRNVGCDDLPSRSLNWSSGTQSPGTFQSEGTERSAKNFHPTVKPTDLMRWLVRLVTPPGGTVLDPFAGSGSTGRAADIEQFNAVLIELDPAYCEIIRRRVAGDLPLFAAGAVQP